MAPPPHSTPRIGVRFQAFAARASELMGSRWAFVAATAIVLIWLISGPLFNFSNAWQLVINTGTTIITFLMVFLIQATQNRDAKATHLKLDELIRSSKARNVFADLEDASDAELASFKEEFRRLRNEGTESGEAAERAHRLVHSQPPDPKGPGGS